MTPPFPDLVSFNCPYCRAFAQHDWYALAADRYVGPPLSPTQTAKPADGWREMIVENDLESRRGQDSPQVTVRRLESGLQIESAFLARCTACQNTSWWWGTMMLWPRSNNVPPASIEMPREVLKLYEEAASIVENSPRGSAALLRLSVEYLCRSLGKTGKVDAMIGDLVKDGLQPTIQQALDAVRVVGNNAVHPGTINFDDSPEVAMTLFHLINLIVSRMIVEPKEVAAVFQMLPEGARAAIARRDR